MAQRRGSKRSGRRTPPETPDQRRERLMRAFRRHLVDQGAYPASGSHTVDDAVDAVDTACDLKANYLGDENPADWSADLVREVFTDLFPSKVLGVDRDYVEGIVPAMEHYVDFLHATDRWKEYNSASRVRQALHDIAPELPALFAAPPNRSMGGKIFQLALDEGVDLADRDQVEKFIDRYNSMPMAWRQAVTDGAGPSDVTIDLTEGLPDDLIGDGFDDSYLDAAEVDEIRDQVSAAIAALLDDMPLPNTDFAVTVPPLADEMAGLEDCRCIRQIGALLGWIGDGRPLTQTAALRRKDTVEACELLGIDLGPRSVQSMWEVAELAHLMAAAIEGGLLDLSGRRIRVTPAGSGWAEPGPTALAARRDVIARLLALAGDRPGEVSAALAVPCYTVFVLVLGMLVDGHRQALPALDLLDTDFLDLSRRFGPDAGAALLWTRMSLDLVESHGIVATDRRGWAAPPAVRPALAQFLIGEQAPIDVRYARGALPLETPEPDA